MDQTNQLKILVVDDDDDHAQIILRTFKKCKTQTNVCRVNNGVAAMEYLNQLQMHDSKSLPDIILLDLNMPFKDGHEVLSEIKSDTNLKMIPVIVMSTSDAQPDCQKAYQSNANSYVVKPMEPEAFTKIVENLILYWGSMNKQLRMTQNENRTTLQVQNLNIRSKFEN